MMEDGNFDSDTSEEADVEGRMESIGSDEMRQDAAPRLAQHFSIWMVYILFFHFFIFL